MQGGETTSQLLSILKVYGSKDKMINILFALLIG